MESSIAVFLMRQSACELLPTNDLVGPLNRKSDQLLRTVKRRRGKFGGYKNEGEETRVAGEAGGRGVQLLMMSLPGGACALAPTSQLISQAIGYLTNYVFERRPNHWRP